MLNEERIVREVCEMWAKGVESVKESWRTYGSKDMLWWNSGRGAVRGIVNCEKAIDTMFNMLGGGIGPGPDQEHRRRPESGVR